MKIILIQIYIENPKYNRLKIPIPTISNNTAHKSKLNILKSHGQNYDYKDTL